MPCSKYSEEEAHIEYLKNKEEKLTKIEYTLLKLEKIEKLLNEVKEQLK